jgi:LysR family transcriptional regulator, low CO2-responsive transcriptional regulator
MKEVLNIETDKLTLRQLRGLLALQRAGSVTGAAGELGLTPPAVSMQIRQLEELVGMPVAERSPTGFVLTEAGLELAMTARRIEAALREATETLEVLRGKEGGRVVVGGVSTAKYFLPQAVAAFVREWPQVSVELRIGNRDQVVGALRSFEIDLAVTGRPPVDFAIRRLVVGDHPYVVVGAPAHPLAGNTDSVPIERLAGETVLMREEGSGTRALATQILADAGISWARDPGAGKAPGFVQTMEFGSNESIKQGVMAGLGIAVISAHTVSVEVETGRLAILPVQGLPIVKDWFVARRREKRLLPAAQAFWTFMGTLGGGFLPAIPDLPPGRRVTSPEWPDP